jgi:glycosyltransferase involved in cell wall biosynthesis
VTDRPAVLWVPHAPWEQCLAQRPWELVRGLTGRFAVHTLTWAARPPESRRRRWFYANPANHLLAVFPPPDPPGADPRVHRVSVPLPVAQGLIKVYPPDWVLAPAQALFRLSVRRLHRRWDFAAVVVSGSHHLTGYPPRLPGVPTVFDYVDTSPPRVEAAYIRTADRVVCVSHWLHDRVKAAHGRDSVVVPNGLYLARHRTANADRARDRFGLRGKRVVSLIGLTCSARLYFLDALAAVRPEFPDVVFVAAGAGPMADRIAARCRELNLPVVLTGWVDPAEVPDLYAATDVGLYPGDDNPYFDGACPLKVLEYTGAGKPVVTNRVAELIRLGFPNLVVRPAEAGPFADGLRAALSGHAGPAPDMAAYDWPAVANRFGDEIDAAVAARRTRC